MGTRFVREGNAFYEIDEECLRKKEQELKGKKEKEETIRIYKDISGERQKA